MEGRASARSPLTKGYDVISRRGLLKGIAAGAVVVPFVKPALLWARSRWRPRSFFVNSRMGIDTNDGKTWATSFNTVDRALHHAGPSDTIYVHGPAPETLYVDPVLPRPTGSFLAFSQRWG